MNYLQFDFDIANTEQSDYLVALLGDLQFNGFEEREGVLMAFIPEDLFNEESFEETLKAFPSIAYTKSVVENINWNQQWETGFSPVTVDHFVAIRASFHQPIIEVKHEIIITPKMSFGTGHHATTHMMVQQMQHIDFTDKTVLDFGTGTGVLAILAEKLGASKVFAIDNDEWSITNTIENIEQNKSNKIVVELLNEIPDEDKYDIILANINLNVILANLNKIAAASKKGTLVLLSGFLIENEAEMKAAISESGFGYLSTTKRGDWISILIEKQ